MTDNFFYYSAAAFAVSVNAFTVGIGQALTSMAALRAINIQPESRADINKTMLFGMALIETTAVLGLFIAMIILSSAPTTTTFSFDGFTKIAMACAICLPGLALGIASAFPARAACLAIARQPFYAQKIMRFMMISISLIQTPVIFGFIVSLIMQAQGESIASWRDVLRIIGSGLAIGLGSIGPAIGLGLFIQKTCTALGVNRKSYDNLFSYTLIRIAVIETPLIFALIISLVLLFIAPLNVGDNILQGIAFLCAGLTVGIGTFGGSISSAKTAASAASQIAVNPSAASLLSQTSMLGQGVIEASVIYPTIIALFLIFFGIQ